MEVGQDEMAAQNRLACVQRGWRTFIDVQQLRNMGEELYRLVPHVVHLGNKGCMRKIFNNTGSTRFM
jgi:hypothetical protein